MTLSGKLYHKHFNGAINSEKVIAGLEHIGRQIKGNWILVWDGSGSHKSKLTRTFLLEHPEIVVEPIPAYAPEVNPEDGVAVSREHQTTSQECNAGFSG